MPRRINDALIPDRAFVASVTYSDSLHSFTTVAYGPNVTAAEQRKMQELGPTSRVIVRSELPR